METQTTQRKPITLSTLQTMRLQGEKMVMLTCYDASFASLMDKCGVDILLVGDSLGMVCQGHASTLPVTVADMVYHTAAVARGNQTAFIVADMPFGTFANPHKTYEVAVELMRAGAHMVKLEGGQWLTETIRYLVDRAIPVCAHLGLTPQSVHQLGGFKVQAKTTESAQQLKQDAQAVQTAGASLLVLEAIPAYLAAEVTSDLQIPTIGIGAGVDCNGQVLVCYDMLGIYPGKKPRFVKNFMDGQSSIAQAVNAYVQAVKKREFPLLEHSF